MRIQAVSTALVAPAADLDKRGRTMTRSDTEDMSWLSREDLILGEYVHGGGP